jgi:hypothetical protein
LREREQRPAPPCYASETERVSKGTQTKAREFLFRRS